MYSSGRPIANLMMKKMMMKYLIMLVISCCTCFIQRDQVVLGIISMSSMYCQLLNKIKLSVIEKIFQFSAHGVIHTGESSS